MGTRQRLLSLAFANMVCGGFVGLNNLHKVAEARELTWTLRDAQIRHGNPPLTPLAASRSRRAARGYYLM
jgi:hypothetical protein